MKNFSTRLVVDALPEDVYAALTNPFAIELWTGYKAIMCTEPGSEFELWEGDICGRNIRFEQDRLIEQEWYFGEQELESIVTIRIYPRGAKKSQIVIEHVNIPDDAYQDIVEGWNDPYLSSLKLFLEEGDE